MAEKIVSPGVFTNEIDQTALPAAVAGIGAVVIGPTARGPANIPTKVTSYSEYVATFGGVITSGSSTSQNTYKYLTNYSAQEYLKYGDSLTVVRTLPVDATYAYSNVASRNGGTDYAFKLTLLSAGAQENSGIQAASDAGSAARYVRAPRPRSISGDTAGHRHF